MQSAQNDNRPRLMTPKEAAAATTFSRGSITALAAEGKFPAPVEISERRITFVRADVEAWIDSRLMARSAA